jgi:hypothetical protein
MNRQRIAKVALASCPTIVLAGLLVGRIAGFGSAAIDNGGTAPSAELQPISLAADARLANTLPALATDKLAIDSADIARAAESIKPDGTKASPDAPEIAGPALADLQPAPEAEPQPVQVATANPFDPAPEIAKRTVGILEIFDECLAVDPCIDQYLWAIYQRTPKEDTIKVEEQRKVEVKKKGKTITVIRTFTRLVDEDFGWKDPKAAERAGMPMMDYVIGGMDRSFKLKLFHVLQAAEQAGLSPGITSAFRDDYRQSIASGLKAASDRSYHGGSSRGGYGHGLAADVVSVKGRTRDQRYASSEILWKWIDAHGKEFGIARPYLDRDPPHLAPTDGKEYASHRGGATTPHARHEQKKVHSAQHEQKKIHTAQHEQKKRNVAGRDDRGAKHPRTAGSAKVRTG